MGYYTTAQPCRHLWGKWWDTQGNYPQQGLEFCGPDRRKRRLACRTRGRRDGRGFYLYGRGRRAQKRVDDTVYMALKITPDREPMVEEIQLRCALVLVNEALRCFDEGGSPARETATSARSSGSACQPSVVARSATWT
jgi:hypothetical protein